MRKFCEKCLFLIDAYMVSCQTWSKNLGRTLLMMSAQKKRWFLFIANQSLSHDQKIYHYVYWIPGWSKCLHLWNFMTIISNSYEAYLPSLAIFSCCNWLKRIFVQKTRKIKFKLLKMYVIPLYMITKLVYRRLLSYVLQKRNNFDLGSFP